MARTRPNSVPTTKQSPTRKVPFCTKKVHRLPRPLSKRDSTTTPSAGRVGLDLSSITSAVRLIISKSLSIPNPVWAETRIMAVSPPKSSEIKPCSISCCTTFSGLASGLSHLLMATMMGTSAALAWLMASTVWGRGPSSAAITKITISVALAPRARMAVKASWPGVSRKVTSPCGVCTL